MNRFNALGIRTDNINENNIVKEVANSIPRGLVMNIYPSDDVHNPLDKQVEVYTYFNIATLDPALAGEEGEEWEGLVKFRAFCRFSATNGTLSLRTVQKNFQVE
jgi:hypothetical protein